MIAAIHMTAARVVVFPTIVVLMDDRRCNGPLTSTRQRHHNLDNKRSIIPPYR
jgi:hypothetical protein